MAKSFNAVWLGDGDPQAQIITIGDLEFIKGRPTKVPADLKVNGIDFADTIRSNPAFDCDGGEPDLVEAPEDDEVAALKTQLDRAGVKYRANASADTLRGLLPKHDA